MKQTLNSIFIAFTTIAIFLLLTCSICFSANDGFNSAIDTGKKYYRQGNLEKAQKVFQKAVNLKHSSADAHYFLGYVLSEQYRKSHSDASMKYLQDQINKHNSNLSVQELNQIYINYGLQPKYLEQSLEEFKLVTELDPNRYMAWYFLAVDHLNNKRYKEAISRYKEALKANPKHQISYSGLGSAYSAIGENELAITYYKKAIDLDSEISMTHYNLAKVYLELGQKDNAKAILKEMKEQKSILYESLMILIIQYQY